MQRFVIVAAAAVTVASTAVQPFTVVHMRVNKDGVGEGRIATGDGFRRDAGTGIMISDPTKPALLTNVRRESVT